jgi:hypothetical protein
MKTIFTTCLLIITFINLKAQTIERYNPFLERMEIYKNGVMIGYSRENSWLKQTDHYDASGNKTGYSRKNPFLDQVDHYDNQYRKKGYSRENHLLNRIDHYDNQYKRTGYSVWDPYLKQWKYVDR